MHNHTLVYCKTSRYSTLKVVVLIVSTTQSLLQYSHKLNQNRHLCNAKKSSVVYYSNSYCCSLALCGHLLGNTFELKRGGGLLIKFTYHGCTFIQSILSALKLEQKVVKGRELGILIRRQRSSRKQANKQIKRDEKFSLERQIHAANMQRNRTICTILEIKENHLYLGDLVDAPEETIG